MSSNRLSELQRQRLLMQEHLAWLDREIAKEEQAGADEPAAAPVEIRPAADSGVDKPMLSLPTAGTESPAEASEPDAAAAEMQDYESLTSDVQRDVRRGCFLYFALAIAFLVVGVATLYFAFRH